VFLLQQSTVLQPEVSCVCHSGYNFLFRRRVWSGLIKNFYGVIVLERVNKGFECTEGYYTSEFYIPVQKNQFTKCQWLEGKSLNNRKRLYSKQKKRDESSLSTSPEVFRRG